MRTILEYRSSKQAHLLEWICSLNHSSSYQTCECIAWQISVVLDANSCRMRIMWFRCEKAQSCRAAMQVYELTGMMALQQRMHFQDDPVKPTHFWWIEMAHGKFHETRQCCSFQARPHLSHSSLSANGGHDWMFENINLLTRLSPRWRDMTFFCKCSWTFEELNARLWGWIKCQLQHHG